MATVELISYTPNPEKIVAAAARLCYSDASIPELLDNLSPQRVDEFVNRLADLGHESLWSMYHLPLELKVCLEPSLPK